MGDGVLPFERLMTYRLALENFNLGFERLAVVKVIRQVVVIDSLAKTHCELGITAEVP